MVSNLSDVTSSDGIPDGIAKAYNLDAASFVFGIILGIVATLIIIGIVKYTKFIIKDNAEMKERLNSKKSE